MQRKAMANVLLCKGFRDSGGPAAAERVRLRLPCGVRNIACRHKQSPCDHQNRLAGNYFRSANRHSARSPLSTFPHVGAPVIEVGSNKRGVRTGRYTRLKSWGSARWQRILSAAVAAAVFLPESSRDASIGIDNAWQAGLALARDHDLSWGPEIVYTHGPLGFLQTSAYYSFGQSVLATAYQLAVMATLFLGVAAVLRQQRTPLGSLICAFIITGVVAILHIEFWVFPGVKFPEVVVLAAFTWAAVPLLQQKTDRTTVFTICTVMGAASGLQLLVKLNTGIAVAVIALALSLLDDWRAVGRHFATMGAFAVSLTLGWILAGQRLGDLPGWLSSSASIVWGYSEGMALPNPLAYASFALSLGWIAALCVMSLRNRGGIPLRFVTLTALVTLLVGRSAVGRPTHFYLVIGLLVVAVAVTPFSKTARRLFVTAVSALVVLALGVEVATLNAIGDQEHSRGIAAMQAPLQAIDRLLTLALPGRFGERITRAKQQLRTLYRVPDGFIEKIGSRTVHIDPAEASVAWAYDLTWRPAPVFQAHQAYTPALDALNGDYLARWPDFVLSRLSSTTPSSGSIDARLGVQESPLYSRALLCNYMVEGIENDWVLLERSGPRCGPLMPLSQASVREGERVSIPAPSSPDMAVLVGIDLDPTLLDRLFQGTVAPLTVPTVTLDGVSYRLIAANAPEPFLVSTPASADGTNLEIHATSIGLGRAPALGGSDVSALLNFYEMRVKP
jgi:hypothetical protein